jgi:hypothetical protein
MRKRWAKHVARMGVRGMHTGIWWGKTEEKRRLEDGKFIMKWVLKKWNGRASTGFILLKLRTSGGLF